eukprot:TRINITY_DN4897_c0_g1_i1.p1 TRINITY_DN4897_c0_g1~~TRINITY_DN4897_c0_g1_i1.p1  ORF type:complete len:72 (-),score=3.90 TRINITY_DN4897_c0_g1_i1:162-377(-)
MINSIYFCIILYKSYRFRIIRIGFGRFEKLDFDNGDYGILEYCKYPTLSNDQPMQLPLFLLLLAGWKISIP